MRAWVHSHHCKKDKLPNKKSTQDINRQCMEEEK
jgi:hypothetical protein